MSWKSIVITGLLCVVASSAWADPQLRVIADGTDGGNQKWKLQVQPDAATLWSNPQLGDAEGASLAVEADLTFSSNVVSATPTASLPDLNNGNNPFTSTITEGVVTDGMTVFAAVGGPATADPLFAPFPGDTNMDNMVTLGDFSALGANWDPGMTMPGKTRAEGDFNGDGFVTLGDFSALGANWLQTFWIDAANITTTGTGGSVNWGGASVLGGEYTSSRVAQAGVNYDGLTGSLSLGSGSGAVSGSAVPEPSSLLLLLCGGLALVPRRR